MRIDEITTAVQAQAASKEIRKRLASLREEEQRIIEASTAVRLENCQQAQRQAMLELQQLERVENSLVAKSSPPARREEITQAILENQHRERALAADLEGPLPTKYIRLDAVEHFGAEAKAAEKRAAELSRKHYGPNHTPGPRVLDEIRDLEATVSEWEKAKRICVIGEKIAKLREERQSLQAERDAIDEQHRAAVLAS